MATDNTKTITTEENKSFLEKTKDTLMGLKNQAEELLFTKKEDKIEGMSRLEFEATKAKLETILHFKKFKDLPQQQQQQQQQFENTKNFKSDFSQFENKTVYGANMNEKYEQIDKQEFLKAPEILHQKTEFHDNEQDEMKYLKMDKDEVHILPTIHVEERPIIIEKEIEYEKPIEIRQTIIHKEKPIIIEQPIIKEKHEHYREATEYKKTENKIVKETVSEQDTGNKDTDALLKLRKERIDQYSDTKPIIQKEKQFVQLDTDIREQPTQIHEKQVVYQQPVEIQKTLIEKIKPKVYEEITLEKEHIHEKLAPEIHREKAKKLSTEQYFSQDTTAATATNTNTNTTAVDNLSTVTNDTTTTQRDELTTADMDVESRVVAPGEQKRKEEILL